MARSTPSLPGPEFHVTATFRAPVDFVFRWCTDYTPGDAALEGESYDRRIVEQRPHRITYEDLEWTPKGWDLQRSVVTLRPPRRWHMLGSGNRVDVEADYRLTTLPDGATQLDIAWRRRAKAPGRTSLTKAQREASSTEGWRRFAKALDADYRASRRR